MDRFQQDIQLLLKMHGFLFLSQAQQEKLIYSLSTQVKELQNLNILHFLDKWNCHTAVYALEHSLDFTQELPTPDPTFFPEVFSLFSLEDFLDEAKTLGFPSIGFFKGEESGSLFHTFLMLGLDNDEIVVWEKVGARGKPFQLTTVKDTLKRYSGKRIAWAIRKMKVMPDEETTSSSL